MSVIKQIDNFFKPAEKFVENHLLHMKMSCHRLILFDSILWLLFILYYIGHYFYTKQINKIEEEHKGYKKILNEKDTIILIFLGLAVILYLHFFILSKN